MSSVQGLNMVFTTHVRITPAPVSIPAPRKVAPPTPSYIYKSPSPPIPVSKSIASEGRPISAKQSLASMFKNIQAKKSCRSCGGFK